MHIPSRVFFLFLPYKPIFRESILTESYIRKGGTRVCYHLPTGAAHKAMLCLHSFLESCVKIKHKNARKEVH